MELKRNSDGTYFASYDGSKKDLSRLAEHLKDISLAGVGNAGFVLDFNGLVRSFTTAREVFYFADGLSAMLDAPFILKLEEHVKNIVTSVFKLDEKPFLSPDEFSDPEE